jgi:predicted transposase YdaD
MPFRFDATLKEIVASDPTHFAAAFGLPSDEPATTVNVELSTLSAAADVALGFGQPIREIADIEFQSGPDPALPRRLLLYSAILHHRYGVPVRSVAILLRQRADSASLTGKLTFGDSGHRLEFEYAVVRLWLEPPAKYLQGPLSLLPLATLCQLPEESLTDALSFVVQEIDRRLRAEADALVAARLMTATQILASLRVKKRSDLAAIFKEIGIMHEMTAWDEALEEGERRGIRRGELRGRAESILRLGKKQFGPPTQIIVEEVMSIQDLDRLDRIVDAILTKKSWHELLATS